MAKYRIPIISEMSPEEEKIYKRIMDSQTSITYAAKLHRWASLINSLACIILDGNPSSNDIDLANDAIKEVLPYLGLDEE
jgi:hypothetical protein